MSVHAGKNGTEENQKQTLQKLNTTQKSKQHKIQQKNKSGLVTSFDTRPIYNTSEHTWGDSGVHLYCAMHFSAKRGLAISCHLSVCLSVHP